MTLPVNQSRVSVPVGSAKEAVCLVTGNQHKLAEFREVLPEMTHVDIDLPEIQAMDCRDVIRAKLEAARSRMPDGRLVVEDSGLHLACLGGFPGALVKWMLSAMGGVGIQEVCLKFSNFEAEATTIIGYLAPDLDGPKYFEGRLKGTIVKPRGSNGFGWDSIFVPAGLEMTLAELDPEQSRSTKMRRTAALGLKAFLDGQKGRV